MVLSTRTLFWNRAAGGLTAYALPLGLPCTFCTFHTRYLERPVRCRRREEQIRYLFDNPVRSDQISALEAQHPLYLQ